MKRIASLLSELKIVFYLEDRNSDVLDPRSGLRNLDTADLNLEPNGEPLLDLDRVLIRGLVRDSDLERDLDLDLDLDRVRDLDGVQDLDRERRNRLRFRILRVLCPWRSEKSLSFSHCRSLLALDLIN